VAYKGSGSLSSFHNTFLSFQLGSPWRWGSACRISFDRSCPASRQRFAGICSCLAPGTQALALGVHRRCLVRSPALTESVTNIAGRADLLGGMAVLSGFLMYLKSAEATGSVRVVWLAGLAIVTTLGVFSKESAVAILPLILMYELVWWREHPPHRALWFGFAATLLPIAVMLYRRSVVLAASPAA
jgi:hypothetical protein